MVDDTPQVSAVMVEVTPELVESEDDPSMEEEAVANLDFCESVVGGPTSTFLRSAEIIVDCAGDVTVGVSSPGRPCWKRHRWCVVSGRPCCITVGVSSPANLAGGVPVGVVPSAVAGVASPDDIAEVASSAYLAEVASSAEPCWGCHRRCDVFGRC